MEKSEYIVLNKRRDFGEKLSATFQFIGQNFLPLLKSILYIVGPFMVITGIAFGYYQSVALSMGRYPSPDPTSFLLNFAPVFVILTVTGIISTALFITVIYEYMMIYKEKQSNEIEVTEVWVLVKKDVWYILGLIIVVGIIVSIGLVCCAIPGIIAAVCLSPVFIIAIHERNGLTETIQRSFKLVWQKWFNTFGLLIIVYLISVLMAFIFAIPMYILTFLNAWHSTQGEVISPTPDIWMILASAIYMIGATILSAIPQIAIAFQYFNLVELKEAPGLAGKIDSIGEKSDDII